MKINRLLFFTIILYSLNLLGQDYIPLIDTTKFWDIGHYSMGHICGYSDYSNPKRYFFKGDTVINTKTYSKVYAYSFRNFNDDKPMCPPFEIDTNYYLTDIFIREEINKMRVFRYNIYTNEEELLYDFNLAVGDTFYNNVYSNMIVDTIYNVTTNDGIDRKCISFNKKCLNCGDRFIEGIGGPQGPFEMPFELFENGYFVMCIKDNSGIVQGNTCYEFLTSIDEVYVKDEIDIYPIPAKNYLYIDFNNLYGYKKIDIISLTGQTISSSATKESKIDINISGINSGYFLIKIKYSDKTIIYKLIK